MKREEIKTKTLLLERMRTPISVEDFFGLGEK